MTSTEAPLPTPVESYGTTLTKAVRTVTWTAGQGTQIVPGQYQEFSLSAGPLPEPGTILLPTDQTYSDVGVVSWDEPTPASGAEPEHPAPELVVTAASTANGSSTAAPGDQGSDVTPASSTAGADPVVRGLGVAGLVLGLVALVVAVVRTRRP